MKDWFAKFGLVLIVGILESVVGLPIFFTSVAMRTTFGSVLQRLAWLLIVGLLFSFLWGFSWWLGVLVLYINQVLYEKLPLPLANSWLKLIILVLPTALFIAVVANIDFSLRILIYASLGLLLILVGHKTWFTSKYEKKYL